MADFVLKRVSMSLLNAIGERTAEVWESFGPKSVVARIARQVIVGAKPSSNRKKFVLDPD